MIIGPLSQNMMFDGVTSNMGASNVQQNNIKLNSWTSDEFYEYGKIYYDEAKKILENLP
jgi:hypothetical protein